MHSGNATQPIASLAVDVLAGRLTRGIDVRLMPAGTVSGRASTTADGLAGVEIELVGERYVAGGTQTTGVAFAQTGALGAFRLDDVLPGAIACVRTHLPVCAPHVPTAETSMA